MCARSAANDQVGREKVRTLVHALRRTGRVGHASEGEAFLRATMQEGGSSGVR